MFVNRKVVPSYLASRPMGTTSESATVQGTFQFLRGEVKEVILPTDARNLSKLYKEYNVDVEYREGSGGSVTRVTFPNCVLINAFGAISDVMKYQLRADGTQPEDKKTVTNGAKVLILCIAGATRQAVILGGLRDDTVQDPEDQRFYWEVNGISFGIDADGSVKLQFRGPTKNERDSDGKSVLDTDAGASADNGPTTVEITPKGNLHIYTKDENQSILIDHENKKAKFVFDQEWNVTVNQKVVENYGNSWTVDCNSSISISAAQDVNFKTTGGSWTMQAAGNAFIRSAGLLVGAATDSMMKGTTYRAAESVMHQAIAGAFTGAAGTLAGAAGTIAGLVASPIVSGADLAPVGAALGAAAAQLGQAAAAIAVMEGAAATYLSPVNKND